MRYSDKQADVLRMLKKNELKRINILHGSIRSGKTWVSLVLWAFWLLTMPRDGVYLMTAKTLTSLKRNCLDLLEQLVGRSNFTYSIPAKEAVLFGRKVYLEGVNDARAEAKIRGMTLTGAYCDELTLFTEDFFAMLLSRLSETGAKLFGTTNPDSPNHWLKTGYIDRAGEIDLLLVPFSIDDNPFLDPDYVREIKAEYTGVFYDRYILGRWVVANGIIYPMFNKARHIVDNIPDGRGENYVSIDYGTVNAFAAGLWKVRGGVAYKAREYYHQGKLEKRKTDEEYYWDLDALIGDDPIRYIVVDPSAASFIECIIRHGKYRVRRAVNDVVDGIQTVSSLLQSGRMMYHKSCTNTFAEFESYRWNEAAKRDEPIKEQDHAMDSDRYLAHTILRHEFGLVSWSSKDKGG